MRQQIEGFLAALLEGAWSARTRRAYGVAMVIAGVLFPFGLVSIAGGGLPPRFAWTASVVIALNALVTVLSEMRAQKVGVVLGRFVLLAFLLFCLELVGVRTGLPFGGYQYTGVLAPSLLGIPAVIPLAWYTTVITSWRLAHALLGGGEVPRTRLAVNAGLLTVALDLVLEPMAAWVTGYWQWSESSVPLQNMFSWFVFAALAVAWLVSREGRTSTCTRGHGYHALVVLGMQWILFALTDCVHGFPGAVFLSAILLLTLWTGRNVPVGAPSTR
jgi:putative membrane protein